MREWIERVDGRTVCFTDGASTQVDGIILGTGYRLSLPWLAPDIAETLGLDDTHIDLHAHTFHPDLPGMAFVGLYEMIGPYLPVLELQARWIAYTRSGRLPAPSDEELSAGLVAAQAARGGPQSFSMQHMALLFARAATVKPNLDDWPKLERALLFGPIFAGLVQTRWTRPAARGTREDSRGRRSLRPHRHRRLFTGRAIAARSPTRASGCCLKTAMALKCGIGIP